MNILIVGCGKTGSRLAKDLVERGYDVSVVDKSREKLEKNLGADFEGITVAGEPFDIDVLSSAGANDMHVAVILTPDDNVNVMVAQTLQNEFNIDKIFTRILNPAREAVFRKFGLYTVCATRYESDHLLGLITSIESDIPSVATAGALFEFHIRKTGKRDYGKAPSSLVHHPNEVFVAVKKSNGTILPVNFAGLTIEEGDHIISTTVKTE
ncbi:MAG: TrkA family potassium uptake protein [Clostridia bacterium]|nr:TrkA family potassium uptake protein [Clostridia bacterium]